MAMPLGTFDRPTRSGRNFFLALLAAAGAQMHGPAAADSGSGVDTALGNALNPRTLPSVQFKDPEGLGETQNSRGPTGFLTEEPNLIRDPSKTAGGWLYRGSLELGLLGTDGDKDNAKFKEYKDLSNGLFLNSLALEAEKPETAWFFDLKGGGLGRDDAFLGASFGRYNEWKVKAFYNETPHVFTTTYRNIYNGVGSNNLTLAGLAPGGTTSAVVTNTNLRTAVMATPYSDLSMQRKKGGVRVDLNLPSNWKAFASYSVENKEGARPFGLVVGGGGGTGGVEIPESIDNDTHDFLAGLQWADKLNALNFSVQASFFRNKIDTLTVENPMFLAAANGNASFPTARFDLHPDNNYYNIKGEYSRAFPDFMRARFTALVSASNLRQNDSLIPSTGSSTTTINSVAGGAWDTLASLSKDRAGAEIDTQLVDLGLSLAPADGLDVKGKLRHYENRNSTEYWACNPLTGQWGRVTNDGSGAAMVNTAAHLAARCNLDAVRALGVVPSAGNINIRNVPFGYKQNNYTLSADYRLGRNQSINAAIEREEYDREHRERKETSEDRIKLGYVNRALEGGTLRLSYEHGRKRGSEYHSDPYEEFLSAYLGPLPTAAGTNVNAWIHVLGGVRKFDLADRDQNIFNARFNYALTPSLDGSLSLQAKEADYPNSAFGRTDRQRQNSLSVDLNWHQSEKLRLHGYYSYQEGRLSQAGLQPSATNCLLPAGITTQEQAWAFIESCGTEGSVRFPLNRAYTVTHKELNDVLGIGGSYDFGKAKLDLNYSFAKGRTKINYGYDAAGLGLSAIASDLAGSGYGDLSFTQHIIEASVLVPVNKTIALHLLLRHETGKIRDWHYDGVEVNPVPGTNQQTYLDAGPKDYRINVIGALVRVQF
ncbi:hypothetical protein BURK2_02184 [Burkholderiales bacterium]|nr:hypothetical protein BURK2_02184 [Burkholderiales bacterium]